MGQSNSKTVTLNVANASGWAAKPAGSYTLTIVAKAPGYEDSDKSNGVTIVKTQNYSITATLSNVTAQSGNPTTIASGSTATLVYYSEEGYVLPTTITVTNAQATWTVEDLS